MSDPFAPYQPAPGSDTEARAMLGLALFWDEQVSFNNDVACATCHLPGVAGLDPRDAALGPPVNPVEMGFFGHGWGSSDPLHALEAKLAAARPLALATPSTVPLPLQSITASGVTYGEWFDDVFATDPNFQHQVGVTRERFALAVATYERTLVPNQAPIDTQDLSGDALRGFEHLQRAGCFSCHSRSGSPQLLDGGGFSDPLDAPLADHLLHEGAEFSALPVATGRAVLASRPLQRPGPVWRQRTSRLRRDTLARWRRSARRLRARAAAWEGP